MIIQCKNCQKKFKLDESLIPSEGRILQCGNCNNKWHFKKEDNLEVEIKPKIVKVDNSKIKPILDSKTEPKRKRNQNIIFKFFSYILVTIITFIAIVLILDTFKSPLSSLIPNLELYLFNLYELLNDIKLFIKDLIS